MPKVAIDAIEQQIRYHMLQLLGLVMHLRPVIAQDLDQKLLDQTMAPQHIGALTCVPARSAARRYAAHRRPIQHPPAPKPRRRRPRHHRQRLRDMPHRHLRLRRLLPEEINVFNIVFDGRAWHEPGALHDRASGQAERAPRQELSLAHEVDVFVLHVPLRMHSFTPTMPRYFSTLTIAALTLTATISTTQAESNLAITRLSDIALKEERIYKKLAEDPEVLQRR